jgi:hypothetical protein
MCDKRLEAVDGFQGIDSNLGRAGKITWYATGWRNRLPDVHDVNIRLGWSLTANERVG